MRPVDDTPVNNNYSGGYRHRRQKKYENQTRIDTIPAPGAARLLTLHKLLTKCKRSLVLCSVSRAIKGILTSNGLDGVLQIADCSSTALGYIQLLRNKV
jgi:hypothetical protein